MTNKKNEHVFLKKGKWVVKREGSNKISKLFENRKNAIEYAGIIASSDGGFVVTHKHNGQFKTFKQGNEIYVRNHKIAPAITGTIEIISPVVYNAQPSL